MFRHHLTASIQRFASHPVQMLLSVLGIAIGIANIITLISLSETAKRQTERLLNDFGANTLFVTPYFDTDQPIMSQGSVAASFLPVDDLDVLKKCPAVKDVCAICVFPVHVGYGAERKFSTAIGTNFDLPSVRNYKVEDGSFFSSDQEKASDRVCVLGFSARKKIFGKSECKGQSIVMKGEKFVVLGSMEERGYFGFEDIDDRIYIPLKLMQDMFKFPGVHTFLLQKAEGYTDDAAVAEISAALRAGRGITDESDDDFKVFSIKDFSKLRDKTFGIFSIILLGVGGIALFVAGIGIMNVMLMSVITRTREVGIRKAVGASQLDIFFQFLAETTATCLVGAVIGLGLGLLAMYGITRWANWVPYISAKTVILAIVYSISTGVVFGLTPAIRAARLDPINALRYE